MDNDIKEIKNDVEKIQEDYNSSVENVFNYLENIYINYDYSKERLKLLYKDLDYIDGIVNDFLEGDLNVEEVIEGKKRLAKIDPYFFYNILNDVKATIDLMQDDFKSLFTEVKNITK